MDFANFAGEIMGDDGLIDFPEINLGEILQSPDIDFGDSLSGSGITNFLGSIFGKSGGKGSGNLTSLQQILDLLGTAGGIYGGIQQLGQGKDIIKNADPFAKYRPEYGEQLKQLMMNPESVTSDPGYQFEFDQGNQAVQRAMAGSGYLGSGNEAIALTQYGQNFAKNWYNNRVQQLMGLSGANISPSSASAGAGVYDQGINTAASALALLGYGTGRAGGGPNAADGEAVNLKDVKNLYSAASKIIGAGATPALGSPALTQATLNALAPAAQAGSAAVAADTTALTGLPAEAASSGFGASLMSGGWIPAAGIMMAAYAAMPSVNKLFNGSEYFTPNEGSSFSNSEYGDEGYAQLSYKDSPWSAPFNSDSGLVTNSRGLTYKDLAGNSYTMQGVTAKSGNLPTHIYQDFKRQGASLPSYDEFLQSLRDFQKSAVTSHQKGGL